MKLISTLALTTAALGFVATASAGDCSTKKSDKTAQFTTTTVAPQTTVLGATAYGATVQTVGYKNKDKGTIIDAAVATPDLSTLVAAVTAADLVGTLSGEGPFTVFAPTNAAFDALPAGTVETLLKPENIGMLQGILKAHVVSGKFKAKNIVALAEANGGSAEIQTVSGDTLTAVLSDGTLFVKDENGGMAGVSIADIKKSNGVVHVIDSVLLPVTDTNS